MQATNIPAKIPLPFANSGAKNVIPSASQISITPGAASLTDGFPPLTFTPLASGGIPPGGADFNGIFNVITAIQQWQCAGGSFKYDSTFSAAVGGYPKGAVLINITNDGMWLNLIDANTTNPDATDGTAANWSPVDAYGSSAVALSNANVTLTPAQFARPIIILSGALTSNVQITFPKLIGQWYVVNATTGAFAASVLTSGGMSVVIGQGLSAVMRCDGANVLNDAIQVGAGSSGTTPPQFDVTTKVATMAAVQASGLHFQNASGSTITASMTMPISSAGHWSEIQTAGAVVTLPSLASAAVGIVTYTFKVKAAATIKGSGSDTISSASATANTLSVIAGETLTLTANGNSWYVTADGIGSASIAATYAPVASPTFSGQVLMPEGTSSLPGMSFVNDGAPDTGFYHVSDGTFGITNNTTPQVLFTPTGTSFSTALSANAGLTSNKGNFSGAGPSLYADASDSSTLKIRLSDNGTVRGYIAATSSLSFGAVNSSNSIATFSVDQSGNISNPGTINATGNITSNNIVQGAKLSILNTGGTGDLFLTGSGGVTGSKSMRANGNNGNLEFINSAYTAVIASISDTGIITANTLNVSNPVAVTQGGTGSNSAAAARTNLGLGTLATQSATSIAVTGGTVDNVVIGSTTPVAGNFTSLAVTSGAGTISALGNITSNNAVQGGKVVVLNTTGTGDLLLTGAGTTAPSKSMRANGTNGNLEFINSAYSAVIASLSNVGALSLNNALQISATTGNDAKFTLTGSSGANPSKSLRCLNSGNLEFINSAYTSVIASLSDAGVFTAVGGFSGISSSNITTALGFIPATADNITNIGLASNNIATPYMKQSSTGNTVYLQPAVSPANCKAWVNFDGGVASPTPRSSFNIASITKNGTGDYTINFTTAMNDANYSAALSVAGGGSGSPYLIVQKHANVAQTTTSIRILVVQVGGGATDTNQLNVSIFGN